MNPLFLATAIFATATTVQSAPSFSPENGYLSFVWNGYDHNVNGHRSENYTYTLQGVTQFQLLPRVGFDVTLGFNEEFERGSFFSNRTFLDFNPHYDFDEGQIGVFATAISHYAGGQPRETGWQYGVIGGHNYGNFSLEGYSARLDEPSSEENTVGIAFGYDLSDAVTAYYAERRDYNTSSPSFLGLATLGVSFDLGASDMSTVPIILNAEYSRFFDNIVSASDSEWDKVSVMATYRFGTPTTSFFRGVRSVDFFYD